MLRGKWWEVYQDEKLNQLEDRIETYNQGLRGALETYLAARDQVKVARSALFPTISASPSVSRDRVSENEPFFSKTNDPNYNDLQITGQASWEPDFWGRIHRTVEAAHATSQANAADMANVDLSLHAEMAADYFQLRGLDSQIKLMDATVGNLMQQYELTQKLVQGGILTDADSAAALTRLETARVQRIDLGVARNQYEHAVGTIADYKLPNFSIPPSPLDLSLPQIPVGVPSQLLERRPDIAAAERRTAAANEQIGIAVSAFYPTITLGAEGGFESTHFGTWIQGPSALWSLGGQATQLLFDAGQRHALTDQARHNYEAQVAAYKSAIFLAFNDVEDQLSGLRILQREAMGQRDTIDADNMSVAIAQMRFKGGVTGYLDVLTAQAARIDLQRTEADIKTRQFVDSVGLIRSLGGGWDTSQLPK
jgi:NodT family efflux transporter outer membrane factor (OMF) lipoprotein